MTRFDNQDGVALVVALLIMILLAALGLSLSTVASLEERVAHSYVDGSEAFYAADAALELAVQELARQPDWNRVLDGSVTSSFVDRSGASRLWPDGQARTPAEATAVVTCGQTMCTAAAMDASTGDRPWGANNPRWQLFAFGPLQDLSPSGAVNSPEYVAVWVGDDLLESDGNPWLDGDSVGGPNPGRGLLTLLVHAYGVSTVRRVVEATVARVPGGVRLVSWREVR